MKFDSVILNSLVCNEEYARKTLPFLKIEYFHDPVDRCLFGLINSYVLEYNTIPSKEALNVELSAVEGLTEEQFQRAEDVVAEFKPDSVIDQTWLVDKTEQFCQDKAVYNAIMASIKIIDDKTGQFSKGSIPKILQDALAVSFDTHIGHDYIDDADARFEFYTHKEERIKFDIDLLNVITNGGLPRKTLNILLAGTGVGKTLVMCHMAAGNLMAGRNVLYITMEMAEERIAERIDANLLNVTLDQLKEMDKEQFQSRMARVKSKAKGKLVIKEYPTASAGSGNFRHLLNELKLKKNFVPDIIYIDYLNICSSSRIKIGSNVNSYTYVKAIAEELRGLAVESNVPIVSATQTTRSGFSSSDPGLDDTSESFGLPATADFMMAIISTEELEDLGQLLFKQLKNRYGDPGTFRRFVVGVDKPKMRLYDVEQSAQDDVLGAPQQDKAVMDKSSFGERANEEGKTGRKFDNKMFDGFR